MAFEILCECGEPLLVSSKAAGQLKSCPKCFGKFQVPSPIQKEKRESSILESVCPHCLAVLKQGTFCPQCGIDIKAWRRVRGKLKKALPQVQLRKALGSMEAFSPDKEQEIAQTIVSTLKAEMEMLKEQLKDKENMEKSLKEAQKKQLTMLPTPPYCPGLQFHALYRPCHHIGGDFYDFIELNKDEIGIAIGDVSGHGLEAGLVMGMAKKTLAIYARRTASPKEVLTLTNEDIYEDLDRKTFVTIFYGVLHRTRKTLRYTKAGHNPLILFNSKRNPKIQVHDAEGMGVGMVKGALFAKVLEEKEIQLQKGDLLIQFTDGLTESMNEKNEIFGLERFLKKIEEYGEYDPEYLIYLLESNVKDFCGKAEPRDDITVIACKVE